MSQPVSASHEVNSTPEEWRAQLDALPTLEQTGGKIPPLFIAHGQPMLIYPPDIDISGSRMASVADIQGPNGSLATFLRDLGPALLKKYSPRAIVIFSAHWETNGGTLVTDYGDENPILYDFFGFPKPLYETKFKSAGDHALSEKVVQLLKAQGLPARTSPKTENRGEDGRGFRGPGFDHGVLVPLLLMLGPQSPIPVLQVSIDASLDPADEWALGQALEPLRSDGVLILSGGLTLHSFQDAGMWSPKTAAPKYKQFEKAVIDAAAVKEPADRKEALFSLPQHPYFRACHPREEHFVPIYIAGGAADETGGEARTIFGAHGCKTIVFGV